MSRLYYEEWGFDDFEPDPNPYADYTGEEDNMPEDAAERCARCERRYEPTNIPNMLRCPACGEYTEVIEADDDGGAWDRSSRHKTRLDVEDDE